MRKLLPLLIILSIILFCSSFAWAKEPATPEYTLQKAIQDALSNSANLKVAEYDVERAYEVRKRASQNLTFVPVGPSTTDVTRPYYALLQADLSWRMAEKNYTVQKDTVEMSVKQAYYGILQAQEKLRVSEKNLKSAKLQQNVALVNFKVGLISKQALDQANANLAAAEAAVETARKALDDAYLKFNYLVGLWPEDRPKLTDVPTFEKLSVVDVDGHIQRTLEDNPSLWLANEKVRLAKTQLNTYGFNDPSQTEPYRAKEIDVDKAVTQASDAWEQARKALKSIYNNICQLEEQYNSAVSNIAVARENLNVVKLKYEVGMATLADVASAEAALAQEEKKVLDIVCQHEILKSGFYKPWAYMASGGAT